MYCSCVFFQFLLPVALGEMLTGTKLLSFVTGSGTLMDPQREATHYLVYIYVHIIYIYIYIHTVLSGC